MKDLKDSRRKEYISRINKVIDYIEENIACPLSLEELAEVSGFSQFHFHRIFTAFTGETLNRFIQRIRVEKAATQLVNSPEKSITDISFDFGFSGSAAFARLFKETFDISASQFRKEKLNKNSKIRKTLSNIGKDFDISMFYIDPIQNIMKWRINMKDAKQIDVEVKELDEMPVAYIRHTGPYAGDQDLFKRLFGELCRWAGPRGLLNFPEAMLISAYHDNPDITDPDNLRMSICLTVPEDTEVSGAIGKMTIGGGKYAVAHFELKKPEEYKTAWETVCAGWLPESGYQPSEGVCFEIYRNNPEEHPEGIHIVDICIPVKPM